MIGFLRLPGFYPQHFNLQLSLNLLLQLLIQYHHLRLQPVVLNLQLAGITSRPIFDGDLSLVAATPPITLLRKLTFHIVIPNSVG